MKYPDFKLHTLEADEYGLIPLLLSVVALVVIGIVLVYIRVKHAQQ